MQALIVHSDFYMKVLFIALSIWFAPEWIGSYFQNSEQGAERHDRGSLFVLIIGLLVALFAALVVADLVPAATIGWQQPLVFWAGIILILVGVGFRWYAIWVLGRYFTRDVATRAGQQVIEKGPYRWIRHPSYAGILISVFGFGLATTNWLALPVAMLLTVAGYSYRVHIEEQALCAALGDAYRDYMRRTRRFIPFVW